MHITRLLQNPLYFGLIQDFLKFRSREKESFKIRHVPEQFLVKHHKRCSPIYLHTKWYAIDLTLFIVFTTIHIYDLRYGTQIRLA